MANMTFGEALEKTVTWTPELRQKLQDMVKNSDHEGVCNVRDRHPPPPSPEEEVDYFSESFRPPHPPPKMIWRYPKVEKEYRPPVRCNNEENTIPT
jgi:hypothetical protein